MNLKQILSFDTHFDLLWYFDPQDPTFAVRQVQMICIQCGVELKDFKTSFIQML